MIWYTIYLDHLLVKKFPKISLKRVSEKLRRGKWAWLLPEIMGGRNTQFRNLSNLLSIGIYFFFSDCDRNMSTKFQKKSKEKHEQKWTFSYTAYYFHGDKSKYMLYMRYLSKKTFSCQKCDYEINSSVASVCFKIKLIKGLTIDGNCS